MAKRNKKQLGIVPQPLRSPLWPKSRRLEQAQEVLPLLRLHQQHIDLHRRFRRCAQVNRRNVPEKLQPQRHRQARQPHRTAHLRPLI
nr:hypothetical protein CFP56_44751 [Quercus suber]